MEIFYDCYNGTLEEFHKRNIKLEELKCESEELCAGELISDAINEFQEKANISIYWKISPLPKTYVIGCLDRGKLLQYKYK